MSTTPKPVTLDPFDLVAPGLLHLQLARADHRTTTAGQPCRGPRTRGPVPTRTGRRRRLRRHGEDARVADSRPRGVIQRSAATARRAARHQPRADQTGGMREGRRLRPAHRGAPGVQRRRADTCQPAKAGQRCRPGAHRPTHDTSVHARRPQRRAPATRTTSAPATAHSVPSTWTRSARRGSRSPVRGGHLGATRFVSPGFERARSGCRRGRRNRR
jgi:hypothetical protein